MTRLEATHQQKSAVTQLDKVQEKLIDIHDGLAFVYEEVKNLAKNFENTVPEPDPEFRQKIETRLDHSASLLQLVQNLAIGLKDDAQNR